MENIKYRYKKLPGDFVRSTAILELPNPNKELENFLVQFLPHFQSDERVTYADDLYKLLDDDFYFEEDKIEFINTSGIINSEKEIKEEIQIVMKELIDSAYKNFYSLVLTNEIEIIENAEK